MVLGSEKRWFVLLNKSPKGPLSTSEVKTLIEQGLLRLNDLAFEVEADGHASSWKLLWQFEEFNRRKPEPSASAETLSEPAAPPVGTERRAPASEEEVKRKVIEHLPPDLAAIRPEDLARRAGPRAVRPEATETEPEKERPSFEEDTGQTEWLRWVYICAGFSAFSFLVLSLWNARQKGWKSLLPTVDLKPKPIFQNQTAPNRAISAVRPGRPSAPSRPYVPQAPPPAPSVPQPREESRYDALAEQEQEREREREQELEREEERNRIEGDRGEIAQSEEETETAIVDGEETVRTKPRQAVKRAKANEEEGEEGASSLNSTKKVGPSGRHL